MELEPFVPFPKIPRLKGGVIVTEKIDGTNALVHVSADGVVRAGSRSRWITPEDDNYGFARFVAEHPELVELGPGYHYGEWWGSGIQRGYGLTGGEKRFSLFNTSRWNNNHQPPACCSVVPTLGGGEWSEIEVFTSRLMTNGSVAAPGFMRPEGVVVYHPQSRSSFKIILSGDAGKRAG